MDNHFTYVVIDEAGHASEPECIIPIAGLVRYQKSRYFLINIYSKKSQIILAGDFEQLSCVIRSPIAKKELETSFLQRLVTSSPLYQRNEKYKEYGLYNPLYITKLINCYRSHPKIIELPSRLEYVQKYY